MYLRLLGMLQSLSNLVFLLQISDPNLSPSVKNNFQSLGVASKQNRASKAIASGSGRLGRCGGELAGRRNGDKKQQKF